jgi:hypothetical protein
MTRATDGLDCTCFARAGKSAYWQGFKRRRPLLLHVHLCREVGLRRGAMGLWRRMADRGGGRAGGVPGTRSGAR